MKTTKFIFSVLGFFLGAFIVKSFFLTTGELIYLRAILEYASGGFTGRMGGFYLRYAGYPIGLFIKLGIGAGLGAVLMSSALNFISKQVSDDSQMLDNTRKKKCPDCAEFVMEGAKICRYCNHSFIESNSITKSIKDPVNN